MGYGFHGVLPQERREGQEFVVDVELCLDLVPAAATDQLDQTVDYSAIAVATLALIEGEPFDLIETLAERVAAAALSHEPGRGGTRDRSQTSGSGRSTRSAMSVSRWYDVHDADQPGASCGVRSGLECGGPARVPARGRGSDSSAEPGIEPAGVSKVYETAPVGGPGNRTS